MNDTGRIGDPPVPAPAASRVGRLRRRVRGLPGGALAWRVGVTLLGLAVVAGGVVLLPLPGPGWLVIFVGLGLLASEYAWAARLLERARAFVRGWTRWVLAKPLWVRALVGVVGLVLLAAALYGSWYVYDLVRDVRRDV